MYHREKGRLLEVAAVQLGQNTETVRCPRTPVHITVNV